MELPYEDEFDSLKPTNNIKLVDNVQKETEITSINDLYDKSGYNWVTIKNIFLTFSVLSVEGLHFTLFSFMIIPLKEYFKMNEKQVAISSSLLFIFVGIGSFFSGKLAEKFGRRLMIILLLFFVILLNIGMTISRFWYFFLIFRCLIGLSIGFIIPMSLNLLTEYLPLKMRAFVLTAVWSGFFTGALVLLFIMLNVMPNMESDKVETTIMLSAILPLIVFIMNVFLLKDSPRNYIIRNNEKEAYEILEIIHKKKIEEKTKALIINESQQSFQDLSFNFTGIFNEKFLWLSLILTFVWMINSVILYGPSITSNLTMKALGNKDSSKNFDIIKSQIFINLINLFAQFFGGLMTESYYLGRKLTAIINGIAAFLFLIFLILFPDNFPVFFAIYTSLQVIMFNVITTYSCEVYPTKIRDHAIGFLFGITRIGGFISQILYLYLNSRGILVPYYTTAIFISFEIIMIILLPYDSYGMALDKEIKKLS